MKRLNQISKFIKFFEAIDKTYTIQEKTDLTYHLILVASPSLSAEESCYFEVKKGSRWKILEILGKQEHSCRLWSVAGESKIVLVRNGSG